MGPWERLTSGVGRKNGCRAAGEEGRDPALSPACAGVSQAQAALQT